MSHAYEARFAGVDQDLATLIAGLEPCLEQVGLVFNGEVTQLQSLAQQLSSTLVAICYAVGSELAIYTEEDPELSEPSLDELKQRLSQQGKASDALAFLAVVKSDVLSLRDARELAGPWSEHVKLIYWPNAGVNGGDRPEKLRADIDTRLIASGEKRFRNTYDFGAGHGAHKTGGLGRMTMWAEVEVSGTKHNDWSLEGKAWLKPDRWDFDWTFKDLYRELGDRGVSFGRDDLKGRQRRTALGSTIPGQPFYVNLVGPLRVRERAGDEWATFSV